MNRWSTMILTCAVALASWGTPADAVGRGTKVASQQKARKVGRAGLKRAGRKPNIARGTALAAGRSRRSARQRGVELTATPNASVEVEAAGFREVREMGRVAEMEFVIKDSTAKARGRRDRGPEPASIAIRLPGVKGQPYTGGSVPPLTTDFSRSATSVRIGRDDSIAEIGDKVVRAVLALPRRSDGLRPFRAWTAPGSNPGTVKVVIAPTGALLD